MISLEVGDEREVICFAQSFRRVGGMAHRNLIVSHPHLYRELDSARVIEYEVVSVFWGVGEEIGTNYVPLGSRLRSLLAQPPTRQLASRAGGRMS